MVEADELYDIVFGVGVKDTGGLAYLLLISILIK